MSDYHRAVTAYTQCTWWNVYPTGQFIISSQCAEDGFVRPVSARPDDGLSAVSSYYYRTVSVDGDCIRTIIFDFGNLIRRGGSGQCGQQRGQG